MIQQHIFSGLVKEVAPIITVCQVSCWKQPCCFLDMWLLLPPYPLLPKHSGPSSVYRHGLPVLTHDGLAPTAKSPSSLEE